MNIPWDSIKSFGQQTMLDQDLFSVSWILGRFCNYKCSYCWPYARTDQPDHQDLYTYKHAIDQIRQQARARGFTKFHWSFSGGEPTAYRDFLELAGSLPDSSPYQSLHMTTNLSPGSRWWSTWNDRTKDFDRRSITASYHNEHANEQEFGDKCLQLMSAGVFVTVNQVMVPAEFTNLYDRMSRLHARGINVTLKPQSDPTASYIVNGYSKSMLKIMQEGFPQQVQGDRLHQIRLWDGQQDYYLDQAERFNAFGFNRFRGWTCNAGYQSVIIRGEEVKRGYSCHDKFLGTLDDFKLFDSAQPCVTASCVSSADSKIPKCR
jgi:organic radical activating enzyme